MDTFPPTGAPAFGPSTQEMKPPMLGPSFAPSFASMGPSFASMGPSFASIGPSFASMGPSSASMGPSSASMGPSFASMGPSSASMGPSSTSMGPSSASMGPSSTSMGPSYRPPFQSTSVSDPLTLEQLTNLIDKIDFEILALRRFPETPTLLATISKLALLRQDLTEIRTKVTSTPPEMKLADVGITSRDADTFLASLGRASATSTYPTLLQNKGFSPSANYTTLQTSFSSLLDNEEMQRLFQNIQFIKWKFEVDYDPKLHEKFFLLERLEKLEQRILSYSSAGMPIPSEVRELTKKELEYVNRLLTTPTSTVSTSSPSTSRIGQSTRTPTYTSQDPRIYDTVVRPSPESVSHGLSVEPTIGQPDYQKRVEFLCDQIQKAGLGTPANFGCIKDPKTVAAEYSWKGNYQMVCSRLGDTWGAWYPEMFGCPKFDPDDKYDGNLI